MNYQIPFDPDEDKLERRLFVLGVIMFLTAFTILYLVKTYYP